MRLCRQRNMDEMKALESVPVRRTRLGFEYVLMTDVPAPLRDRCWAFLRDRGVQLTMDEGGRAALLQDWRLWLDGVSARSSGDTA
jgi:hypothetical protein